MDVPRSRLVPVRAAIAGRLRRDGLQLLADLPRCRVVGEYGHRRVQLVHDVKHLAVQVEGDVPRSGAWRQRSRGYPRKTTVAKTECLHLVDAKISGGDVAAGAVEDDGVRVRRLLARLVRAAASVLEFAAHRAKSAVGPDRQDNKVAADIVGDDQVTPAWIHGEMRRNRTAHGLAVEQRHHAGIRVYGERFDRSGFLALVVVDLVDDVKKSA